MRILFTAVGIIAFTGTLAAQTKTPAAKPVVNKTAVADKAAPADKAAVADRAVVDAAATAGPDEYAYKPEGRRDPFLGLTAAAGTDVRADAKRGDGLKAFMVGEISVRGVMQSRSSFVAMIKGPDNKTYLIHQGDKLADGVVKTVTPQGLVVLQDISDPLSAQKQREVRKLLRSLEDAKEKL
jgi:Tfp pilus assembly protein PilP